MSKNKIEESQQQSQGVTIGTAGNNDMKTPQVIGNQNKEESSKRSIPNQDRSSASNSESTGNEKDQ